jgi:DNA topoisomerase-1
MTNFLTRWLADLTRRFAPRDGRGLLVIVESPAKAETLREYLKADYPGVTVMSSLGHLRDLPKDRLAVDVAHGFKPEYEVAGGRDKTAAALEKKIETARRIILATDPDREGEAVAWHIVQLFQAQAKGMVSDSRTTIERVTFNAVTPEAVRAAFRHPRPLDLRQVKAAVARRVADRLIGYVISPALWRGIKGKRGTSAGRVQSAALRLLVERDRQADDWRVEI